MKTVSFLRRFHWKMVLMRIVINAIVLVIITVIVPFIRFVDPSILSIVLLAFALGVLNALVKPVLQFVFLPLIFASYGLVIVLVNTLLLLLLAWLFPDFFVVERLFWALVGGALIGILGTFFEILFGLIPPILPDEETGLRRRFREQRVGSLGGMSVRPSPQLAEEEQLVIEAPEDEGQPIQSELETQRVGGVVEAETPTPEASPSEGSPSEADASVAPPESVLDVASNSPGEQAENPIKEEDEQ
jgi:putative membrane protein